MPEKIMCKTKDDAEKRLRQMKGHHQGWTFSVVESLGGYMVLPKQSITSSGAVFYPSVMSDKGLDLLKSIERLNLKPYDDQTGLIISKWTQGATIGYGHLIPQSEWSFFKDGITKEYAETLFESDLSSFYKNVTDFVTVQLMQYQFDALVMLAFNIGSGAFKNSSVVKMINNPGVKTAYSTLQSAWYAYNKSQKKENEGLKNRRECEWNIYSENIYKPW